MQFFRTTGVLTVPIGFELVLNEIQAKSRETYLTIKGNGKCKVKIPIQFKAGEIVGIKNPDKTMLRVLEEIEGKVNDPKN